MLSLLLLILLLRDIMDNDKSLIFSPFRFHLLYLFMYLLIYI